MSQGRSGHIFISYSRRDDAAMRRIAFFLRDQKFRVWVDNEKLVPGTPTWEAEIEKAIGGAVAVIVVLSPTAKESEWVRREIAYADQYRKRVFPVLVDGDEDTAMPIRLITRQYLDFRSDEDAGLESLRASLNLYLDEKQTMEMKRPAPATKTHPSAASPVTEPAANPVSRSAGKGAVSIALLLGTFVLGAVVVWAAYQMFLGPTTPEPARTPAGTDLSPLPPGSLEKASEYLDNVQVQESDTFDAPTTGGWEIRSGEITGGVLKITGTGGDVFAGVMRMGEYGAGQGVMVDFSFSPNSLFEVFWNYGNWESDAYRRFGIYAGDNTVDLNLYEGVNDLGGADLSEGLILEADVVYTLLLAILPDGEFLLAVWNPASPSQSLDYVDVRGESWGGLDWTFWIQVNTGTLRIDNFGDIIFSGAR